LQASFSIRRRALRRPRTRKKLVKQLSEDAIKLLTGKELCRRRAQSALPRSANQGLRRAVHGQVRPGAYWRDANDQERQDYQKLFEDLIVATYAQRFADYQGESFKVLGSSPEDDKVMVVQSQITRMNPPQPIRVDWRVLRTDQGLRIVDVIVEGVSLSVTQRSEFASVIQRNGGKIGGLLDALRQKTKDLHANG